MLGVVEPSTQVEIQLGHMCNNRCVFCVSGQQTAEGRARPLPVQPLLDRVSEARAKGHKKITLLGGEPTLQPGFPDVVRHAVALGFEEIVVFTNGVKTAREGFVDEVLELGAGRLTWRISLQGATKLAHERTTRRPGSFDRIVDSLGHLQKKQQRITVNMCVVQSNFESVVEFPELIRRFGARQLHLDMVRPLDAGVRTEAEFAEMIPRYSQLAPLLVRMVNGFEPGFDVNIGNLPYCIAPELAHVIHHDGEATETIAVDGEHDVSRPWNKYFVKRRDKNKPAACAGCVFEPRCSGLFDKYRELHGDTDVGALTRDDWLARDPELRLLWPHLVGALDAARACALPRDFERLDAALTSDVEARLTFTGATGVVVLVLRAPGLGVAGTDRFSVHVAQAPSAELALAALRAVWPAWLAAGYGSSHPPGEDLASAAVSRSVAARLGRLRAAAPFATLAWTELELSHGGARAELTLRAATGDGAVLWLADEGGRPTGGYRILGAATPTLVEGLRAALGALSRAGARDPARVTA